METPTHDKLNYLAYQLQYMAKKACCKYIFWKGPHKVLKGLGGTHFYTQFCLISVSKKKKPDDLFSLYFVFLVFCLNNSLFQKHTLKRAKWGHSEEESLCQMSRKKRWIKTDKLKHYRQTAQSNVLPSSKGI